METVNSSEKNLPALPDTIFNFHNDPAHGWLEVPFSLLKTLGIEKQITAYSYSSKGFAFLEEDLDLATFLKAYFSKYGVVLNKEAMQIFWSRNTRDVYYHSAPMRNFPHYHP